MFSDKLLLGYRKERDIVFGLCFVPGLHWFTAGKEALRLLSPWPLSTVKYL